MSTALETSTRNVAIPAGRYRLEGILSMPAQSVGIVVFAHGSGSGRHSPRNQFVAEALHGQGLATLLIDLLTEDEAADRANVFDIGFLAARLLHAARWLSRQSDTQDLPMGFFGASTGAGAALMAAARQPATVAAVVSRGGRPDLAADALPEVLAPTRLIVGGADEHVLTLNEMALARLRCAKDLVVIPGATHLFSEPGALEEVARLAADWFHHYLAGRAVPHSDREPHRFRNRIDAAQRLATALKGRTFRRPLILGIPRGGMVIADVLARELDADLDIVLSRKLRAPWQPEFAIGAVSETGEVHLNPDVPQDEDETRQYVEIERRYQLEEIDRRKRMFRGDRPPSPVADRSVIVTDDGIATGSTMIAALQTLRAQNPFELLVAAPVAPPDRIDELRHHCDEVVCLLKPSHFSAVGEFYDDFTQVEDDAVERLLRDAASRSRT